MATMTSRNPIKVDSNDLDECPTHGEDVRREYTFGMEDADVIVFRCGCAACIDRTDGFGDRAALFPDYNSAAGLARLIVAGEDAFANKYGF